ncbi:Crotonobetainyl-CoA:carnitine CoA-transferase CaiB [Mesobacillus persicus]|uniref:Crotonobetainyl-CoA:carnitine CoA-transferase CaiB n=1 Tax=Mesobacillus persicus TaxID=930146 RepID=A0A1H8DAN2_9BACI|nr:CoA transferase [Mesobacillus persicus]SEN04185.1 Crotonobetainyl-CoA:carnitine CoA-transferase CaiB [Mesobacillus persicus]
MEKKLLTGLRVLDLTEGPSGEYAIKLLAKSGASVTKVQSIKPFIQEESLKIIEVSTELEAKRAIETLFKQVWDIVLWTSHFDLDEWVKNRCQKLGLSGVKIQVPKGVDLQEEEASLQALGGWMELTGDPLGKPLLIGGHPATCLVGVHAATAGLLVSIESSWNGKGKFVEVDALTVMVSALEGAFSTFLSTGETRGRVGNRHYRLAPMALLPAKDGYALVAAPVDEKWELVRRWAELSDRPAWKTNQGRLESCFDLEENLSAWTTTLPKEELFQAGQQFRLPFAKVQTPGELLQCPQLAFREAWTNSLEGTPCLALPWKVKQENEQYKRRNSVSKWSDLRILDLTGMWSGPYCTRIFADLGVEVIKIEAPHRPDGIRMNQGSAAPFFRELNRNKLGVTLDFRLEHDRKRFLELVATSDILVENFSPRVMQNFGFTSEELWKLHSGLTIVSLSAFGQTGPYRDFVGYGPTLEAMSGIAALTGVDAPCLPGFSISDINAGIHGAFVLAAGLFFQSKNGRGLHIDVSQYETALQFIEQGILFQKKNKTSAPVREIAELYKEKRISTLSIPGGEPTLGVPWHSDGWDVPTQPPPELGQHNEFIFNLIKDGKGDGCEVPFSRSLG